MGEDVKMLSELRGRLSPEPSLCPVRRRLPWSVLFTGTKPGLRPKKKPCVASEGETGATREVSADLVSV